MKIISAGIILAALAARYPANAVPGDVSLSAAAEPGQLTSVDAAAVQGYNPVSGPLKWVKATENFTVAGTLTVVGDYVEVREKDANWLVSQNRAVVVPYAEVEEASLGSRTQVKGSK